MLAIERPKNPKVIKCVWWDGYNKKEVEKVFPTVGFSRFTVNDKDPYCIRVYLNGNYVRDIEAGVYVCCEVGHSETDIFTLSKKQFEEKYCNLPIEG